MNIQRVNELLFLFLTLSFPIHPSITHSLMEKTLINNITCYVLGASVVLGLQNVYQNWQNYLYGKNNKAPKLAMLLNATMVAASLLQLLNQLLFIIPKETPVPEGQGLAYCNGYEVD